MPWYAALSHTPLLLLPTTSAKPIPLPQSEIIARDFFPGLLETKHQQDYLNALDSHDPSWIASASRSLTEVMSTPRLRRRGTSFATPRYETPGATPHKSNPMAPAEDTPQPTHERHLSLDAFQAKYTSEDNASFNDLLDAQNEKKRSAYAFLWSGNRIPGFRVKAEQKRLRDRATAEEAEGGPRPSITWVDDRKAVPNTWKVEPRNTLMFAPEHSPPPPELQHGEKELPPKTVVYSNTRMPPPPLPGPPPSPSFSTVRDAIAGNPRLLPSESGAGGIGADTPRVNGYSFVRDAPSPSPSELGAPPLTWGSIAAISSTDSAPMPFKLAPTPRRELLHHRMVDRVAKNKRVSNPSTSAAGGATPKMTPLGGGGKGREIPRFQSTPVTLTPAGQRLWSNLTSSGQGGGVFGGKGVDAGGRMRWMPTPRAGGAATPRAISGSTLKK